MTDMSEYLFKLSQWHKSQKEAAADRLRRATTADCIDANKRTIHLHETASITLAKIAASWEETAQSVRKGAINECIASVEALKPEIQEEGVWKGVTWALEELEKLRNA